MRILIILYFLAFLSACALSGEEEDATETLSAKLLYEEARSLLDSGNYAAAVETYNKLETRYPFGEYAQQSLLDLAYSYYKQEDADQAITTINRFIKLYPQNPHIDYAYYLKGLTNFNRDKGLTKRFLPIDESQRDPSPALQAFQDFAQLADLFPDSIYIEDSQQRMIYLRNTLAKYEVHVANYYMRRGAFIAAVNRARYVVENYPKTPAVPDALVVMAKAYKILEIDNLSQDAIRVLKSNYRNHPGIYEIENIQIR